MITVLKQNRPLICLHNICMSRAKALLRLHTQVCIKPSLLAFAIKIINSSAGSHDRSDLFLSQSIIECIFTNNHNDWSLIIPKTGPK